MRSRFSRAILGTLIFSLSVVGFTACGDDATDQPDVGVDTGMDTMPEDAGDTEPDTEPDTCEPTTCEAEEAECGEINDGCGGTLDCGTCEDGECGLMEPNVCGCDPWTDDEFCTETGAECGLKVALDNCGVQRSVACGSCDNGVCEDDNTCTCVPEEEQVLCNDNQLECGQETVQTRCGERQIECGTCDQFPASTCQSDNTCTCTPKTCSEVAGTCGVFPDGCGGTVNCTSGCTDYLATGGYHTCYQDPQTDQIQCWGWNKYGQLGLGTNSTNVYNSPQNVVTNFSSPTSLTAGEDITCVVDSGSAKCWGANYYGQALGSQTDMMGNDVDEVLTPASPNIPGVGLRTIEAHTQHTCGITTTDELYCWGYNWIVALGSIDPSTTDEVIAPRQYSFGGSSKATAVDTGALHTCAEGTSGALWCWGNAFFSAIGDGSGQAFDYVPPKQVIGFANGFIQVESGGMDENDSEGGASFMHDFSCAIDNAGAAKCWGSDADGELGNRAMANTDSGNAADSTPQQVYGLNQDVTDLALGGAHACAIQNGDIYCWGDNEFGQVGDGTNTDRNAPVLVDNSNISGSKTPTDVEAGYYHTCVIYADNSVACWGRNSKGQLGDGSTTDTNKPKIIIQ